jgi:hypothetical protein
MHSKEEFILSNSMLPDNWLSIVCLPAMEPGNGPGARSAEVGAQVHTWSEQGHLRRHYLGDR